MQRQAQGNMRQKYNYNKEERLGQKARVAFCILAGLLLFLAGCGVSEETLEQTADKAGETLNKTLEAVGGVVQEGLDKLHNAEYQGGPFENDLDSARAYLLAQLEEKYGTEFAVVGDEDITNYGLFAGATYTCQAAPLDAPEQVATALVSQSMYRDVRDDYAVYFFNEEAERPVLELCGTKDYVIDQRVSLEMPGTAKAWTADDDLAKFLSESGAYVKVVLRFEDDLEIETYAAYLQDFINSVDQLECNLLLQAKANKIYIFHRELNILGGFDSSPYTMEYLRRNIETSLSMGAPR